MDEDLKEQIHQLNEDLFLTQSDLESARNENIALKNFIQNLYESCEGIESNKFDLQTVLDNLMENIRDFSRVNGIRL